MTGVQISVPADLIGVLQSLDRPVGDSIRELVVLELYRQGRISSGKAAELLGMPRVAFIQHASRLGIPFYDMTSEEWQSEMEQLRRL